MKILSNIFKCLPSLSAARINDPVLPMILCMHTNQQNITVTVNKNMGNSDCDHRIWGIQ